MALDLVDYECKAQKAVKAFWRKRKYPDLPGPESQLRRELYRINFNFVASGFCSSFAFLRVPVKRVLK